MAELELRFLGEMAVVRDGEPLSLPPSKKTRGLLAYLALTDRTINREQLCELLWEIPDDPRGSLRWSLSKIRKLVDDADSVRVIANRNSVTFNAEEVMIDARALVELAGGDCADYATDDIASAVDGSRGLFLEGLDLPNFHDFYTWCISWREQVSRAQSMLLQELLTRLADSPDQALDYAARLVSLQPYDEPAWAAYLQILLALGRKDDAQTQLGMARNKLAEGGVTSSGLLQQAMRKPSAKPSQTAVHTAAPRGAPTNAVSRTLVGRDEEVERITRQIESLTSAGAAGVTLVRGEPGIGKTRLLQATAAAARDAGAGLLRANAFESDMIRPFGIWNDALRRALPDNPVSALLASGDTVSREVIFNSLCDLLQHETQARPTVFICDDVQWCDESSISALNHVLRMNAGQPLLAVLTTREAEYKDNRALQQVMRSLQHDGVLDEIRLGPLSQAELGELISTSVPGADADSLSRECAGNPLLALELARAEVEGDSGSSLAELVRERLSHLDEFGETVLLWAAVLSPRVNLDALTALSGAPRGDIDAALERAIAQGMLIPGEWGFRFSHDLIARAVYEEIPRARCQSMHRQVAEYLETSSSFELSMAVDLSHHARRSGDPALAVRAIVSAAKLCLRFYAYEDALDLYREGVGFAEQLPEAQRVCALLELCDIRLTAAPGQDGKDEVEEYVDLAEQAIDLGAMAHARLGYQMASYVRWSDGHWRDAQRFTLQAERVARSTDDEARIQALGDTAKCLALLERDLSQADALAMEAQALAERNQLAWPAIPIARGILCYYAGAFDEALELLELGRTLSKSEGNRPEEYLANEYLVLIEFDRGDYAAAQDQCRGLVAIGERIREGSEGPFAVVMEAVCGYGQGAVAEALNAKLDALRLVDAKQRLAVALNRIALLDVQRQCYAQAAERAQEALSLASTMGIPSEMLQAYITLHQIHLSDPGGAAEPQHDLLKKSLAGPAAAHVRTRAEQLLQGHGAS